ncbi:MAG: nitrogenase component 1 [Holophaga sp.]|nr:nitrogenase component 1 [Holophaga sp.]
MFLERPRFTCPLGGAMATVNALPGAVAILHASPGCGGNSNIAIMAASGNLGSGYCGGASVPASGISEKQIVFGGSERIIEQLETSAEVIQADLFVVITGCTAEIIGDDMTAVLQAHRASHPDGPPVIHASGAGFKGNSYFGYDSVLQSLFRQFLVERPVKVKGKVNLWGVPPALDVFWEGNLVELKRVLQGIGLEVNAFFTKDDTLAQLRNAAEAELNIVVSPVNGVAAAETFRALHGVDYLVTDLPIGAQATAEFLQAVAGRLHLDQAAVDRFLRQEKELYYHYFGRLSDSYSDLDLQRYAVIVADTTYAVALSRFVEQELGWLPRLVAVTDPCEESARPAVVERFAKGLRGYRQAVVFETDTSQMSRRLFERWPKPDGGKYYQAFSPAFVIGSRLDKEFADSIGAGHLSVAYPISERVVLNRGYAGYRGALHLIEDIFSVVLSNR